MIDDLIRRLKIRDQAKIGGRCLTEGFQVRIIDRGLGGKQSQVLPTFIRITRIHDAAQHHFRRFRCLQLDRNPAEKQVTVADIAEVEKAFGNDVAGDDIRFVGFIPIQPRKNGLHAISCHHSSNDQRFIGTINKIPHRHVAPMNAVTAHDGIRLSKRQSTCSPAPEFEVMRPIKCRVIKPNLPISLTADHRTVIWYRTP